MVIREIPRLNPAFGHKKKKKKSRLALFTQLRCLTCAKGAVHQCNEFDSDRSFAVASGVAGPSAYICVDLVLPHHWRREKRVIFESVSCASRRGTALNLAVLPAHFFRHLNNRISTLDFLLLTQSDWERASGVPNTVRNAAELFILQR